MARLRYNGLSTTLGAALSSSATAITFSGALTHAGGTAVPTIVGTNVIPLTLLDASGKLAEVVHLTAYTSGATTGTIARAKDGTSAKAHASGAVVRHAATSVDFAGAGAFRGEWVSTPLSVGQVFDFSDGLLTPFTRVETGTTSGQPFEIINYPGGSMSGSISPAPAKVLHVSFPGYTDNYLAAQLRLADTSVAAPAAVRFWWGNTGGTNGNQQVRFARNGAVQATLPASAVNAWSQTTQGVSPGDTLQWRNFIAGGAGSPYQELYVARVEILTADTTFVPYQAGQFVTYLGAVWESQSDNNTGIPGTDSSWRLALDTRPIATLQSQVATLQAQVAGLLAGPPSWGSFSTLTKADTDASAHTVPIPSTAPEAGDLMILMAYRNDSGDLTAPSGWSKILGSSASRHHVFTKVATASEAAPSFGSMNINAAYVLGIAKRNSPTGSMSASILSSDGLAVSPGLNTLALRAAGAYFSNAPTATVASGTLTLRAQASGAGAKLTTYSHDTVADPLAALTWTDAVTSFTIGVRRA